MSFSMHSVTFSVENAAMWLFFLAIDPTIIDCPQGQAASWLRPTGNSILGPQVGWLVGWCLNDSLVTRQTRNEVTD